MISYIAGVFTLPAIFVVGWLIAAAMERGMEITCACGYFTGPMRSTRRIVMWSRWRWHRLTHNPFITTALPAQRTRPKVTDGAFPSAATAQEEA